MSDTLPSTKEEAKEKGSVHYFTGKPCKHGHMSPRYTSCGMCVECIIKHRNHLPSQKKNRKKYAEKNPDYHKEYYKKNKEALRKKHKDWRESNKERKSHMDREYRENNRERVKEIKREYHRKNKDKINEKVRDRYRNDPVFLCREVSRRILKRTISYIKKEKEAPTRDLLGYSEEYLKFHIESLFLEGMSWDNYGEWHIDHIYPISRFVLSDQEDPSIINALDNLHPMWAEDNLTKGDMTLYEYLEEYPDKKHLYERNHYETQ